MSVLPNVSRLFEEWKCRQKSDHQKFPAKSWNHRKEKWTMLSVQMKIMRSSHQLSGITNVWTKSHLFCLTQETTLAPWQCNLINKDASLVTGVMTHVLFLTLGPLGDVRYVAVLIFGHVFRIRILADFWTCVNFPDYRGLDETYGNRITLVSVIYKFNFSDTNAWASQAFARNALSTLPQIPLPTTMSATEMNKVLARRLSRIDHENRHN